MDDAAKIRQLEQENQKLKTQLQQTNVLGFLKYQFADKSPGDRLRSLLEYGLLTDQEFDSLRDYVAASPDPASQTNNNAEVKPTKERPADGESGNFWKKPLFGDKSLVEKVTTYFAKQTVPLAVVDRYAQLLKNLEIKTISLKRLENNRFSDQEFLDFFRIRIVINLNIGAFKNLKPTIDLLEFLVFSLGRVIK